MTFKHINFDDSPVMRSLERMTISKEPQKQLMIEKTTSNNKPDFTPTEDFFSNLTKLCSGLRDVGLSKYADELENNYLRYKQAQTAYETSKETGEDLVDQAHPQGSVQVGEGEYGIIETILDQQLRTLKIIDKKPTGKLSNAADIINAVKLSFAEEEEEVSSESIDVNQDEMIKLRDFAAQSKMTEVGSIIRQIEDLVIRNFGNSVSYKSSMLRNTAEAKAGLNNISKGLDIRSGIKDVMTDLSDMEMATDGLQWKDLIGIVAPITAPYFVGRHIGDAIDYVSTDYGGEIRDQISALIDSAKGLCNIALEMFSGRRDDEIKNKYFKDFDKRNKPKIKDKGKLLSQFDSLLSRCRNLKGQVAKTGMKQAEGTIKYIDKMINKLETTKKHYNIMTPEGQEEAVGPLTAMLTKYSGYVSKIESSWVGYFK